MGWLKTTPIVTLLLALAFAAGPLVIDPAHGWGDRYDQAVERAHELLTRNPRLVVEADGERVLDPEWLADLRAAAEESDAGAEVELPARMVARSQTELDGLLAQIYEARRLAEPAWRLGVLDGETPTRNYWAHAFVHESVAGLLLMLAVLLVVGAPLERSWGSLLYGAFVVLSIPMSAQGYRLLDASNGVPWSGSSGLAAALVGAYFIRGLGGQFVIPSFVVLPVWMGVEAFVVRGFWIDDLGSVPWATLCGAIGAGAAFSALIRLLGVERRLDARSAAREKNGPNPVVVRAARLRSDGDPTQAFELIQAAWREHRTDEEIAEVFYSIAVELGQPGAAAEAILPVLRSALKKGQIDRALSYWLPLAQQRCEVRLEPTAAVRLGEALLDAGHPDEALFSLRSAIDAGASTAHAVRILNIARDLDPGLTRRAAGIALADPSLDAETRERLMPLAAPGEDEHESVSRPARAAASSHRAAPASAPAGEFLTTERTHFPETEETTAPAPVAASAASAVDDLHARLEDQSLVGGALSEESLGRDVSETTASGGIAGAAPSDVLSHWNDKSALSIGALEGAAAGDGARRAARGSEALLEGDLLDGSGELFGDDDIDLLDVDDDVTDSDQTPLLDSTDELTSPMAGAAKAAPAVTSTSTAEPATTAALPTDDPDTERTVLFQPPAPPSRALLRTLRAIDAVPLELSADGVEIDTDGRGKSRLPIARIEAVALAAVRGLGPRPVLVVDCVLNWRDDIASPLKLIRFRSDRFEAAGLGVEEAGTSPVAGLAAFASKLQRASRAACLPSEAALAGSFPSFDSLEAYERAVLGAEREPGV